MENILGEGAYGTVYKAKHRNGNTVAIKIVKKHIRRKPDYETVIVGLGLKHENIVELTEHFTITNRGSPRGTYIVMEYCNGGDLNAYMIKNNPDQRERIRFMSNMARGVWYLHSQNVVHRDIKPENVLMAITRDQCICKITGFGLSRVKEEEGQMFSTCLGLPAFKAPEIGPFQKYSNPVDVFSLGLLFFSVHTVTLVKIDEKLQLLPAVDISETDFNLLTGVLCNLKKRPELFVKLYFSTSLDLGRLVYRMVEEEPEDRPSMEEVVKKIEDLVDEERDNRELPEETESVISEENTEYPDEAKSAKPEEAIHSAAVKTETLNTETDMSDEPLDEESDYHSQNASDENALLIEPSQKQVISCFKAITCIDVQNVMLCFTYIVYTSVNLCCFFQGLKQKGNKGLNNETFRFKIIILYPS